MDYSSKRSHGWDACPFALTRKNLPKTGKKVGNRCGGRRGNAKKSFYETFHHMPPRGLDITNTGIEKRDSGDQSKIPSGSAQPLREQASGWEKRRGSSTHDELSNDQRRTPFFFPAWTGHNGYYFLVGISRPNFSRHITGSSWAMWQK